MQVLMQGPRMIGSFECCYARLAEQRLTTQSCLPDLTAILSTCVSFAAKGVGQTLPIAITDELCVFATVWGELHRRSFLYKEGDHACVCNCRASPFVEDSCKGATDVRMMQALQLPI